MTPDPIPPAADSPPPEKWRLQDLMGVVALVALGMYYFRKDLAGLNRGSLILAFKSLIEVAVYVVVFGAVSTPTLLLANRLRQRLDALAGVQRGWVCGAARRLALILGAVLIVLNYYLASVAAGRALAWLAAHPLAGWGQ